MKYTREDCEARAVALEEAAEHLALNWTDDPRERAQGEIVARQLHGEAGKWRDRAIER